MSIIDERNNEWDNNPLNPYNWSLASKLAHVAIVSISTFLVSFATSIISPAIPLLMSEFSVSRTTALLTLSLYVIALAFGPIIGGPLSETIGRKWVYVGCILSGAAFTAGCSRATSFGVLCAFRALSGFCWGPIMAIAVGTCVELFRPKNRGPASALVVLMAFLGPGVGPVVGAFLVDRHGWRWSQYCLLIISAIAFLLAILSKETFAPILQNGLDRPRRGIFPSFTIRLREFVLVSIVRPIHMLFFEPVVTFTCLYVSLGFGILFSFFAAVPYTFGLIYEFDIVACGLVFLSIVIGCFLGLLTILICDKFIYQRRVAIQASALVPPEYRLYSAMIGSVFLPVGLFWFGWSVHVHTSWMNPVAAISLFAWGNICVFVSTIQFKGDTYTESDIASVASANSLARYGFAAVFPLFTIQIYQRLGVEWASSLLGFVALAMMPIPWVLFKYGPILRKKSKYQTIDFRQEARFNIT